MRRSLGLGFLLLVAAPSAAHASFHLWDVAEVFSDSTGTIQYIELFSPSDSQQFVNGATITASSDGVVQTFTFPGNSPAGTANKRLLIGTTGYSAVCGSAPVDFVLPNAFFDPAATTLIIDFGGGADIVTITTPKVPVDGSRAWSEGVVVASSPTNFAGTFDCVNAGSCVTDCGDLTFCNGAEACTATGCAAADPCPGEMCDETTDACFECAVQADCEDGNLCTDDVCDGTRNCVRTNNTLACNDGLFCTTTDTCSGGACTDTDETCPGENCSEGGDFCGDCDDAADCSDDVFCNGAETCSAGACGAAAAGPCDLGIETCDEDADACAAIVPPDAGVPDATLVDAEVELEPDAGPATPPDDAGCCSTTRRGSSAGTLVLLAFVLLGLRRPPPLAGVYSSRSNAKDVMTKSTGGSPSPISRK